MTPEQKQRAKDALKNWLADEMGDLLQELIDAPEVEPALVVEVSIKIENELESLG